MNHVDIYNSFLEKYSSGNTSGEEVGLIVAQLVQCYTAVMMKSVAVEQAYNKKYAALANSLEENGKTISMAKADILVRDTDEYNAYNSARKELSSIEQEINGLKTLQRGVLNEYAHMGNT